MARRVRRRPRRWGWLLLLLPALLAGAWFGGLFTPPADETVAAEQQVRIGQGWAVTHPAADGIRTLSYLVPVGSTRRAVGPVHSIPAKGPVTLSADGDLLVVQTEHDGAPQYAAYQAGADGLTPADYYTLRAPAPSVTAGHYVLVDKQRNALWHYENGRLVKAYRVSTGRQTAGPGPTCADYATNFFTPEGRFRLTKFVANPAYGALKPGDRSFAGGEPGNPLGTRWIGFVALDGGCDSGNIYAVHGTHEPERIGTWASDGCIRMQTLEAEELFARLRGQEALIEIIGGQARGSAG